MAKRSFLYGVLSLAKGAVNAEGEDAARRVELEHARQPGRLKLGHRLPEAAVIARAAGTHGARDGVRGEVVGALGQLDQEHAIAPRQLVEHVQQPVQQAQGAGAHDAVLAQKHYLLVQAVGLGGRHGGLLIWG